MKKPQKSLNLLPTYFKIVGLAITLFSIVFLVAVALYLANSKQTLTQEQAWCLRTFCFDAIIIGLSLFAVSKDKIEDEFLMLLRLEAMAFAFLWSILYVVFNDFTRYFIQHTLEAVNAHQVVFTTLLAYIVIFIYKKKKM